MKSILCIVGGTKSELATIRAALELAKSFGSHVRFLHISPDPSLYASFYDGDVMLSANITDAITSENVMRLAQAKQYVEEQTKLFCIPLDNEPYPVHHASACFIHKSGHIETIITNEGRLSDIIVIARGTSSPNALYDNTVVASLFSSGRPVLLLPDGGRPTIERADFKTIAIAWKETLESARALHNSLPLLAKAEKIYTLIADGNGTDGSLASESALMDYLKLHGIYATGIVVASGNRSPEESLLIRAKELQADLLVMGAYGHSRFREMMFGGATNFMLEKADIPLLLSH